MEPKIKLFLCRLHEDENVEKSDEACLCEKCKLSFCMYCSYEKLECKCKCQEEFTHNTTVDSSVKFVPHLNFSFCKKHPDYQAVYICQNIKGEKCDELFCVECEEGEKHPGHKLSLVRKVIEKNTTKISQTKDKICNLIQNIEDTKNVLSEEKVKMEEDLKRRIQQIKKNEENLKNVLEQLKEEKKKELRDRTLGDLPGIKNKMSLRLEEFERRQNNINDLKRFSSVKSMRSFFAMLPKKALSKEDTDFIKELEEKLFYGEGKYFTTMINWETLDVAKISKQFDKIKQADVEKLKISGYNFSTQNFDLI
jgi:DNA repair exonuclease SbcCD ATPase subunit